MNKVTITVPDKGYIRNALRTVVKYPENIHAQRSLVRALTQEGRIPSGEVFDAKGIDWEDPVLIFYTRKIPESYTPTNYCPNCGHELD